MMRRQFFGAMMKQAGGGALLLDTYSGGLLGLSCARQLSASATNCITVRRSSDNTEQIIGFVGGVMDTASLLTFVGAGNGFVSKVWAQIGSNHATQSTLVNQPTIVSSGSLITQNGKPSMLFSGTGNKGFLNITDINLNTGDFSFFMTYNRATGAGNNGVLLYQSATEYLWLDYSPSQLIGNNSFDGIPTTSNTNYIASVVCDEDIQMRFSYNSTNTVLKTGVTANACRIDTWIGNNIRNDNIYSSEISIFNVNNIANRTAIETNLNDYYAFY